MNTASCLSRHFKITEARYFYKFHFIGKQKVAGELQYTGTDAPVHTIPAHRGNRDTAQLNLNRVVNFTPQLLYTWERIPVPNEWEAGWAPEQVWMV